MTSTTLILIPTENEAAHIQPSVTQLRTQGIIVEHCGFGPIVAAARTMQAVSKYLPSEVVLLGIAGAYDDQTPLGAAFEFDEVVCYGVGAGSGADFRSALQMGWKQWAGSSISAAEPLRPPSAIADTLRLRSKASTPLQLVTCCAASASEAEAQLRHCLYPAAFAEDMEGFGVAIACHLGNIPLRIIRGISNRVGHRDLSQWKIAEAMHAACERFIETFSPK